MKKYITRIIGMIIYINIGFWTSKLWDYISYVQPRIPSPSSSSTTKLWYIAVQMPNIWWAIATGVLAAFGLLMFLIGRFFQYKRNRRLAIQTLHWKTRETARYHRAKNKELEGRVEAQATQMSVMKKLLIMYKERVNGAMQALYIGGPIDEVSEHKLLLEDREHG